MFILQTKIYRLHPPWMIWSSVSSSIQRADRYANWMELQQLAWCRRSGIRRTATLRWCQMEWWEGSVGRKWSIPKLLFSLISWLRFSLLRVLFSSLSRAAMKQEGNCSHLWYRVYPLLYFFASFPARLSKEIQRERFSLACFEGSFWRGWTRALWEEE